MNERKNKKQSAKAQAQQKQPQEQAFKAPQPAESVPERTVTSVPAPGAQLSTEELRNAIFWSEIIAKPKYLETRERRRAKLGADNTNE